MKGNITGILNDVRMLLHKSKKTHPQAPQRVIQIMKVLRQSGYLQDPRIQFLESYERKATNQQICYVYPQKYVKYIQNLWPKASHRQDLTVLDTYFCQQSQSAARISAGGVLLALDKIMKGDWKNGYSIIRPPGHHSGYRNTITGFCIFNNVAIGARYLQKIYGLKKVVILDWDIHHGDGTHAIFEQDPNVLFISVHRYDNGTYYPAGEGHSMHNCGKGIGEGSKINIPLNHIDKNYRTYEFQAPGDNQYVYIYNRIIQPIIKEFDPQFIIVSSGYDAGRFDPLGGFTVTPNGYYYMTKRLVQLGKPLLAVLQGGYNLQETALASLGVVKGLLIQEKLPQPIEGVNYQNLRDICHIREEYHSHIDEIIQHHRRYWKSLQSQQNTSYTHSIKKNQKKRFGVVKKKGQQSSSSSQSQEQTKIQQKTKESNTQNVQKIIKAQWPAQNVTNVVNELQKQQKTQSKEKKSDSADDQCTNQFYFAAGHMQRFKNFSIKRQQILKWAYPQQVKFYESSYPQKKFAPKYFGREGEYIIIENLLYNQQYHIVVDFKMSRSSKRPELTQYKAEKIRKKQALSTTQKYALRVSGFTTPTYKQTGLLIPDENFLRKILGKVVTNDNRQQFCTYLRDLADSLRVVNRKYINTSILLIKGNQKSTISWIDFHYIYENCQSYDKDLVEGIENLIKFISQVEIAKE